MNFSSSRSLLTILLASSFTATTAFFLAPATPRGHTHLDMANIAVFGASGLTASECVYQALANGDTVVGLTRYVR